MVAPSQKKDAQRLAIPKRVFREMELMGAIAKTVLEDQKTSADSPVEVSRMLCF